MSYSQKEAELSGKKNCISCHLSSERRANIKEDLDG
jgi:hypothetical protein